MNTFDQKGGFFWSDGRHNTMAQIEDMAGSTSVFIEDALNFPFNDRFRSEEHGRVEISLDSHPGAQLVASSPQ